MGSEKTKTFIDSNVWFSGFYKKGAASDLINQLLQRNFEIVISELVLEEVIKNISQKIPLVLPLVYRFFQECPITVVKNPSKKRAQKFTGLAQKKDLPILVSALNYQCQFFVTGNKKDFKISSISKQFSLLILNPREMLREIQE